MFESLQKLLLKKAINEPDSKKRVKKGKNKKKDLRSTSGIALDEAMNQLENSGSKMDMLLEDQETLLAQAKAEASKKMTPERRALIDSALRIRKAQEKILADLDDETKAKLYLTALRAFQGDK